MGHDSRGTGADTPIVKQIVQRAASDWLSLRRPADHAARDTTLSALVRLSHHLSAGLGDAASVSVLDLGAGTGSNLAWLGPRLDVPQVWTLIDRDEDLLRLAFASPSEKVVAVQRLTAELDAFESAHPHDGAPTLVTCSALLDVLTTTQVESLCQLVVSMGAAALFSLTVTGDVELSPRMGLDRSINETFNAHQERDGLAGPGATSLARQVLHAAGFRVEVVATPWELGPQDAELVQRYLADRVASVVEHEPALAEQARAWLAARREQVRHRALRVRVGHEDLVALPRTV